LEHDYRVAFVYARSIEITKVQLMSYQSNESGRQSMFDELPDSAFIRESQLVLDPKRPQYPAPLPFSAATLWRKVAAGTFPRPVKLSNRVTAWRVAEVRGFLQDPVDGLS
jgi:predicted DNA-binding transcriptional regulator AlpA